ncbi:MAG: hypothetical protein WC565_04135 [Parcubacteria group bacterium]
MFKAIDLLVESAASPVKQAWDGLIRDIQKYVEHNRATNGSLVNLARGDVVFASGQGEVSSAITDIDGEENIAVCAMDIAIGDSGIVRTTGYAYVHFEDDLTDFIEGEPAYLSDSFAGRATHEAPIGFPKRIGIIADVSGYQGNPLLPGYNPFALVCLGYSCAPVALIPN